MWIFDQITWNIYSHDTVLCNALSFYIIKPFLINSFINYCIINKNTSTQFLAWTKLSSESVDCSKINFRSTVKICLPSQSVMRLKTTLYVLSIRWTRLLKMAYLFPWIEKNHDARLRNVSGSPSAQTINSYACQIIFPHLRH